MFAWGASITSRIRPPADSMEIFITGKRGCGQCSTWKAHAKSTAACAPEPHIKLTMTSEDVTTTFHFPHFAPSRTMPGRYTTNGSRPDTGRDLPHFCAEYCGTKHSDGGDGLCLKHRLRRLARERIGEGSMAEQVSSVQPAGLR